MSVYREQRIVIRCLVEFERLGRRIEAETEDLSERGVFVRTEELLAVGAVVALHIYLPNGSIVRVVSRVAHLLIPSAARSLGRRPGMGFQFLEHDNLGRDLLVAYLDQVVEERTEGAMTLPGQSFAVIAEPSPPLADRIDNALAGLGFESLSFRDGDEAVKACHEFTPDVVVAALEMPGTDGLALLTGLKSKPALAEIPVVFTADAASDIARLQAYRMGARDVIPKPFTDEELCIRVRRAALESRRPADPVLRGNLNEISLATLLSLFEFERKSGILLVFSEGNAARLTLGEGHIVRIDGPRRESESQMRQPGQRTQRPTMDGSPVERIMHMLDWTRGRFEFNACEVVMGTDDLGLPTQHLLLEHARVRDEAARDEDSN
jgi:CheY-like chemotaxis protein/Tfp pilus assembly protein PilZ